MTTSSIDRARAPQPVDVGRRMRGVVPVAAAAVVAVRLLSLHVAPAPDEGGFLMVAGQWVHGTSLYGHYWVDRPPLLISLFALADLGGGLVALRVLGIVAAVTTLLLLAAASRRVFGRRAAAWTAVVAAALLCAPLFGSREVNGELLAAPFVALGLRAAVEAVLADDVYVARAAAVVVGAAAAAALMVKQNIADVAVFALVAWIVAGRHQALRGRRPVELGALAIGGGAATLTVILLVAASRGTSPVALFHALYPFRLRAAALIATSPHGLPAGRLLQLGAALLFTGAPLVVLVFCRYGVGSSRAPWLACGLLATAAYDVLSIVAGGGFWLHYEVELLPAVALMAGAASLRAPRLVRSVAAVVALSAALSTGAVVLHPLRPGDSVVGHAIARSARPGDTMISAFGDADIPYLTGMSSPYPYLWSLPSRVLDPGMALLRGVLSGPVAPTWIVVRGAGTEDRLAVGGALQLIHEHYREVALIRSRHVYLRDGVDRPVVRP
ncbi:MAG TPA: glycosyltransferase family 39 protein [Marmoricola sp.]|nr:glycosyltransferase family 39 protein [Marmoricola sp.]